MKLEAQTLATERTDLASSSPRSSPVHFLLHLQKQFQRRRRYELSSCIVGLLGIALMLAECEIIERREDLSASSELALLVLKSCVLVSTVLLDVLLVLRYRCDGQLVVCSFHVPPGVGGEFEIVQLQGAPSIEDDSVCVFMAARLYLLARFVRSSSALHSPWISLVGSLNGVEAMKPFFHFKSIFKLHPLNVLLPLTLLNTLLTAAIVRVLERPVQAVFDNYWKSIWFTIVTLSGTGLGDYFPVTYLGRAFSVAGGMFCGVLIVALVQSLFFNFLDLSPSEKKVRYLIELEWWEKSTRQNAARLLQAAWRAGNLRRGSDVGDQRHLYSMMRTARRLRVEKPTIELSIEDQIAEMEAVVLAEVDRMEAEKMVVIERIQAKTMQLAVLKGKLEQVSRQRN
ncbi:Transmembrane protein [Phytophthora cinnamomi]|uniref:Transmembrane protein n=1 Tax=Phytophthora cinnamomi TaxID=4785 RepID=UPI00355A47C4|nr:Transmembrane protein [Phytophthora cinnamomi]